MSKGLRELVEAEVDTWNYDDKFGVWYVTAQQIDRLYSILAESDGKWLVELTDDEHTRLLGWARILHEDYGAEKWDELDEGIVQAARVPAPKHKGEQQGVRGEGEDG